MDRRDPDKIEHLAAALVQAGREGGPEAVQQFLKHPEFDLLWHIATFVPPRQSLLLYPWAYRRYVITKRFLAQQTPGTPPFWAAAVQQERNLAALEFGRLEVDFAERTRLRTIRAAHGMDARQFHDLVGSLGGRCSKEKLLLRPPKGALFHTLSLLRKIWSVIVCYLLMGALVQVLTKECFTCSSVGVLLLAPAMLMIWRLFHILSEGWRESYARLHRLSIAIPSVAA